MIICVLVMAVVYLGVRLYAANMAIGYLEAGLKRRTESRDYWQRTSREKGAELAEAKQELRDIWAGDDRPLH